MKSIFDIHGIPKHILFQWEGTLHAIRVVTYHAVSLVSDLWEATGAIRLSISANFHNKPLCCVHYLLYIAKTDAFLRIWTEIEDTWIHRRIM
jgi:hypothetical protein